MEPVSEKREDISVDEDPNKELSEGICQEGNVASGLETVFATLFAGSFFVTGFGFFPPLTYTITIL